MEYQNIVYVKFFKPLFNKIYYLMMKKYLIKYIDSVLHADEIDHDLLNELNSEFNVEIYHDYQLIQELLV